MKGIIFREFLDMTEDIYGDNVVDEIITKSGIPNNGAYTNVGTYDHHELVQLLMELSSITSQPPSNLLNKFGKHLFKSFSKKYSNMLVGVNDGFSFLKSVEGTIHVEVLKLYPEAELPSIKTEEKKDGLELLYTSNRKMGDFAEGLIEGCMAHFNENVDIEKQLIFEDGSKVLFIITKK